MNICAKIKAECSLCVTQKPWGSHGGKAVSEAARITPTGVKGNCSDLNTVSAPKYQQLSCKNILFCPGQRWAVPRHGEHWGLTHVKPRPGCALEKLPEPHWRHTLPDEEGPKLLNKEMAEQDGFEVPTHGRSKHGLQLREASAVLCLEAPSAVLEDKIPYIPTQHQLQSPKPLQTNHTEPQLSTHTVACCEFCISFSPCHGGRRAVAAWHRSMLYQSPQGCCWTTEPELEAYLATPCICCCLSRRERRGQRHCEHKEPEPSRDSSGLCGPGSWCYNTKTFHWGEKRLFFFSRLTEGLFVLGQQAKEQRGTGR